MTPRFLPTARQTNWLASVSPPSAMHSTCATARSSSRRSRSNARAASAHRLCGTFRLTIVLFEHSVLGAVALGAALLHLLRPSLPLLAIALAAAAFGIVLHNPGLSALAGALLIVSLARPAPAPA
jgi:hypothetical protein